MGLEVMVGGLGLGYTAHAALSSPRVPRVEAMELLHQVIDWRERDVVPRAPSLRADARFEFVQGDVDARRGRRPSLSTSSSWTWTPRPTTGSVIHVNRMVDEERADCLFFATDGGSDG